MSTIIYTCPECGSDLQCLCLTSLPPQTKYNCIKCGWSYTEPPEKDSVIIRIPYQPGKMHNNVTIEDAVITAISNNTELIFTSSGDSTIKVTTDTEMTEDISLQISPEIKHSFIPIEDTTDLYKEAIDVINIFEIKDPIIPSVPESCKYCKNHPNNGGSGICHCILGGQTIY